MKDFRIIQVSEIVNSYELNVWPHTDSHERVDKFPVIEIDATPEDLEECRVSMPRPPLFSRFRERLGLTYHHQPLVPYAACGSELAVGNGMEIALVRTVPSVALVFFTPVAFQVAHVDGAIRLTRIAWRQPELATAEAAWFRKAFVPPLGMMWAKDWWKQGFSPQNQ